MSRPSQSQMNQSSRPSSGQPSVLQLERIESYPDMQPAIKKIICSTMKRRSISATDLLTMPPDRLASIFDEPSVLVQLLRWRQVELWKVEKLPTESAHFHSAAKTGNIIAGRDILARPDLPPNCASVLVNHQNAENNNRTALCEAAYNGHPNMIRFLVNDCKANTSLKDSVTGSLAIHLAAEMGRLHSVMVLIEAVPTQLAVVDNDGNMPLNRAASNGQIAVVEYLVSKKSYLENYDEKGRTPLVQAASRGHLQVVKFLVSKGADVYAKEFTAENMAVHMAAEEGHSAVVAYLVELNPEFRKIENRAGKNPLQLAQARNHEEVIQVLTSTANDSQRRSGLITPTTPQSLMSTTLDF